MSELRPLHGWTGPPARLTLWHPTAEALSCAERAPPSAVPPSYEQAQHLRSFRACERQQEEMARLLIVVWEEPGQCDIQAMSDVVTQHLRRHDTYHSRFEELGADILRRVFADPADIRMEPVTLGEVSAEEWQRHAAAVPSPHDWDCFRFGVLQRADGFTCFASIDHLHGDVSVIPLIMREIHAAYRALIDTGTPLRLPPPLSYLDYCTSQRERTTALTLADGDVAEWLSFFHCNGGRMPAFPLPLGVQEDRCVAEYAEMKILDGPAANAFEAACDRAGARMIGGLLACAAMTERYVSGRARYGVVTPVSTRKSPQAFRSAGWCMGVVPVDLEHGAKAFPELAAEVQRIFEARLPLASVPVERVLELAAGMPSIRPAVTGGVMLSFNDMSRPPLSPQVERAWEKTGGRIHFNPGMSAQVAMWLFRTPRGLTLTAAFPANDTARRSLQRYLGCFAETCRAVAGVAGPPSGGTGPG